MCFIIFLINETNLKNKIICIKVSTYLSVYRDLPLNYIFFISHLIQLVFIGEKNKIMHICMIRDDRKQSQSSSIFIFHESYTFL